jgi:ferredoxin
MVKRMIVKVDEQKYTGCGKCVTSCAEDAISVEERYTIEF